MKRNLFLFAILIAMASCQQKQEVMKKECAYIRVKTKPVQTVNGLSNEPSLQWNDGGRTNYSIIFKNYGTVEQVLVQEDDNVHKG